MKKKSFFLVFLVFLALPVLAQEEGAGLFKGGGFAGFNASQLDGDNFRGYDKLGLHAGVKVKYYFPKNRKMALHMEMLYSMEGSSENLIQGSSNNTLAKLKLDYIEVPLIFSYREWKIDFYAGMAFARLINSKTNDFAFYTSDDFRKFEMSVILGATYMINENWGTTLRFSRSVTNAVAKGINQDALLGHLLTLRLEYYF